MTSSTPLRSATATLVTIAGLAQVAMLWVFDLGAAVLLTALSGGGYLLLGLGLFGVSRFTLVLAAGLCGARAWLAFAPLPVLAWEQLRTVVDVLIAATALWLLWQARHAPTH
ncbi:hypothetical protein [Pseudohaliea rubra]|uniref:Uncharacterized protein n=1 Tax=Pseudohaliea rubra DSM 19751 TaxID=1265313 RepID=A0A095VMV5_9GAMM|nr:hypothetical protein [Pseudohaliea rubra]KGE02812.1 hypothetical protein HRUBRA_02593 [Pseudohaliea rubra DSM 19751]